MKEEKEILLLFQVALKGDEPDTLGNKCPALECPGLCLADRKGGFGRSLLYAKGKVFGGEMIS